MLLVPGPQLAARVTFSRVPAQRRCLVSVPLFYDLDDEVIEHLCFSLMHFGAQGDDVRFQTSFPFNTTRDYPAPPTWDWRSDPRSRGAVSVLVPEPSLPSCPCLITQVIYKEGDHAREMFIIYRGASSRVPRPARPARVLVRFQRS